RVELSGNRSSRRQVRASGDVKDAMKCFVGIIVSSGEVRRPAVGARIPQLAVVANRPLIDHALDTLGDAGVRRAYIVAPNDQFAELDTAVRRRTGAVPKIE